MAKLKAGLAIGLVCLLAAAAAAAPPREINVTSDSTPGWLPSEEMTALVEKTARGYWSAKDGGHAADAYAFLNDMDKTYVLYPQFSSDLIQFNAKAGNVLERRIVKVTWTKDPAQAPVPGIYAALDLVGRFANIDRYCGYLILYQAPGGGPFQVMREEENMMENTAYGTIVRTKSQSEADDLWKQISAHCPNYQVNSAQP